MGSNTGPKKDWINLSTCSQRYFVPLEKTRKELDNNGYQHRDESGMNLAEPLVSFAGFGWEHERLDGHRLSSPFTSCIGKDVIHDRQLRVRNCGVLAEWMVATISPLVSSHRAHFDEISTPSSFQSSARFASLWEPTPAAARPPSHPAVPAPAGAPPVESALALEPAAPAPAFGAGCAERCIVACGCTP
jgi:hypothetical protein